MATVDVLNFAAYVSISCFLASSSASLPQKELSKLLVTLTECVLLCPKLKQEMKLFCFLANNFIGLLTIALRQIQPDIYEEILNVMSYCNEAFSVSEAFLFFFIN